jgi:hypothetical protein
MLWGRRGDSVEHYRANAKRRLSLDRGNVTVATGNGMSVFARDLKITPVSNGWTEFYVSWVSGAIQVIARKNRQAQRSKKAPKPHAKTAPIAGSLKGSQGPFLPPKAPILTSVWAEGAGVGAGGALLGWVLAQGDDPVSPHKP